jgi:ATP-dependent Clp protease protease subunit
MLRLREVLFNVYVEGTGQAFDRIASDCERNKWLASDEMLEYGLVDRIVERLTAQDT